MATKLIEFTYNGNKNIYCIVKRKLDSYYLNNATGGFNSLPIADMFLVLNEDVTVKGYYSNTEARTVWNSGVYLVMVYERFGGSPNLTIDMMLKSQEMFVFNDAEINIPVDLHDSQFGRVVYDHPNRVLTAYRKDGTVLKRFNSIIRKFLLKIRMLADVRCRR